MEPTTHYVQQYTTNVQLLLQQRGSKLRGRVSAGSHVGKQAAVVDQIGKVTAQRRTTRYPDLTPQNTPSDRRWVFPADYDWNDLVDSIDKLRTIIDPTSSLSINGAYAMGRAMDDEIITAFFADAKTGETGATTTAFPAAQQVSASEGAAGATGMNIAKLRAAKKLLLQNEVDVENDPLIVVMTAKQHDNLLNEAQAISLDYNDKPVLVEGKITSFMGFEFVLCERLVNNGSSQRRCPAYAKSGMYLGIWNDISTNVSRREDKAGLPWQVYVYGTFGATRVEEGKVVEIPCA